jgi:thioesterase domain-containing protein/acyl carrier protein
MDPHRKGITMTVAPGRTSGHSLVEQSLLDIWRTTLGKTDISPTDHFFELGGDSLMALMTIEQTNQRLGWTINMGDLLRHPTIEDLLASRTSASAANSDRLIVRMSNRGSRVPIVFVHPVTGLVFAYAKLVRLLGSDRGCYSIQSPLLAGSDDEPGCDTGADTTCTSSIVATAEHYADLIEDEFGDDEFHLVGWSVGGVIALEIARAARDRGLGLRDLVLLDSYVWTESAPGTRDDGLLAAFRTDILSQVVPDAPAPPPGQTRADVLQELSVACFGAPSDPGTRFVERLLTTYETYARALADYRPDPVNVDAMLLITANNYTLDTWQQVICGELRAQPLDGDHYGLVREAEAEKIAGLIDSYVSER